MELIRLLIPELVLIGTACALLLLGVARGVGARRLAPMLALIAVIVVFGMQVTRAGAPAVEADSFGTLRVSEFTHFIKLLSAGVGAILILLAWPGNDSATGNSAADYGSETSEFFSLLLLSIAGIFLVAGANDMILLFLGIELASIPTYIMVSVSRRASVAQEAGVKYFFLGAMAAALMLFGFSYLYGTTGTTNLHTIAEMLSKTIGPDSGGTVLTPWQLLAVVIIFAGFSFKLAAVPLHFYAGDVYQGAATPVTALLSYVPKATGIVATIKLLYVVGGGSFDVPTNVARLLWVIAALTMTAGNILAVVQVGNLKRLLAYSSVAHSGYMLVGLTALSYAGGDDLDVARNEALAGVLFYLAAYGVMNAGAFGILMLLPARPREGIPGEDRVSAETFEDIAGQGRAHPVLGLAMAVCMFSLIGLPLTVGFFGKFYLIKPAFLGKCYWLVVIMLLNAAVSAAYYLKVVATMFLRPEGYSAMVEPREPEPAPLLRSTPVLMGVMLSVAGTLLFGAIPPATQLLRNAVRPATAVDTRIISGGELRTSAQPAAQSAQGSARE